MKLMIWVIMSLFTLGIHLNITLDKNESVGGDDVFIIALAWPLVLGMYVSSHLDGDNNEQQILQDNGRD